MNSDIYLGVNSYIMLSCILRSIIAQHLPSHILFHSVSHVFWHVSWHAAWQAFLRLSLAHMLTYIPTCILTWLLTCCLASLKEELAQHLETFTWQMENIDSQQKSKGGFRGTEADSNTLQGLEKQTHNVVKTCWLRRLTPYRNRSYSSNPVNIKYSSSVNPTPFVGTFLFAS